MYIYTIICHLFFSFWNKQSRFIHSHNCSFPLFCYNETWYGIHDFTEFKGEFRDKYLMNHLQPGASFLSEYTIEVNG